MNTITCSYETLLSEAESRGLALFYITLPAAYTVMAPATTFILQVDITTEIDIADFESSHKPTATEVGSPDDALAKSMPHDKDNVPNVRLIGPIDRPDYKAVVVVSPSRDGWMTWFTSRGDDPASPPGRAKGPKLDLSFIGPDTKTVEIRFTECIEIHDGEVWYMPVASWTPDDEFSVSVILPATIATPNVSNTGNCNLMPVGPYDVILPAAGDGSHDVDFAQAVPVPASEAGFWDCDYDTGITTPSATPGKARYHLLTGELEMFFLRNVACGHPLGSFEIDVYKAEWVHPSWKVRLTVLRTTAGPGRITGWLMVFRPGAE